MKRGLKLFVWTGVLTDWTSGLAFALAKDAEAAKAILMKQGLGEHHWEGTKLDGQEPEVYTEPYGCYVHGGS